MRTPSGRRLVAAALVAAVAASVLVAAPTTPTAADGNEAPGAPAPSRGLTMGDAYACALVAGDQVKCWGRNRDGELGLGDTADRGDGPGELGLALATVDLGDRVPVELTASGRFHFFFGGREGSHTCARFDDGQVACWGRNAQGELGLGHEEKRGDGPGELGTHLATVDLGTGRTATALTSADRANCAVLDDGTVKCWGLNGTGQLGQGDTRGRGDEPGEMGDALAPVDLGTGRTATAVTGASWHFCALLDGGQVKCWGGNFFGQLGLGDSQNRGGGAGQMGDALPAVDLGTGRTATAVSTGGGHTCALLAGGDVKCWGAGGALGLGDTLPRGSGPGEMGDALPTVDLGTGRSATAISAGADFTCALLDDGSVKCWGENRFGQLGLGDTDDRGVGPGEMGDALPAVDLGAGRTATAVTAGDLGACARLDDGSVKCWGDNEAGALGQGDTAARGDGPGEMGDALAPVALGGTGVAGRVRAPSGDEIRGALVAVLDRDDFGLVTGAVADLSGYHGAVTPPGDYFAYVIDPAGVHEPGFFGPPTTVTVAPEAVAPVDPVLPARGGAVAGTITEAGTGAPIPTGEAIALDATTGEVAGAAASDPSGHYTLTGLPPGAYRLVLLDRSGGHAARFFPDAPDLATSAPVTVTAGATTDADATLPTQAPPGSGTALSGRVRDPVGTALPGMLVVALRADDLAVARAGLTGTTGGYALSLAPGDYVLVFLDPTGDHRVAWHLDPATSPALVHAVLEPTVGSMSGTVTGSGGAPIPGTWVVAIRANGAVAAAAVAGPDGTYRIDRLPPDTYRAAILDPATGRLEYWLGAADYATGDVIDVPAGADVPVDATLGAP
ncbi:MAG: carboxypeptidase regulatory-like domain-containing protein [Acidimicrobiales bacterium]|nr:carboxypeptidase regulatory-like domain-containing protein [Acidimicrobiales bacterium]